MELVSRWLAGCALAFAVALVVVPAAGATPQAFSKDDTPASVRVRAYDLAYNLDYDEAIALMRSALERWPRDPTLHRSLGTMVWLKILFTPGSVTIADYLGPLSKQYVSFKPPPASLVAEFVGDVDRAAALAQERLARQPNDLDALYEYGAAVGLRASYTATVEGRMLAAVRATLQAYKAHERVLRADPRRAEAGLLVGTYQYIIANLSWPLRWMALVVGFSASRERGLQLLERASQPPSDAQIEARFGLLIIYSRERRYDEAYAIVRDLARRFPRNRMLWWNAAATALSGGRIRDAERDVDEGFARFEADARPRVAGEAALWHFKRGAVRVASGRRDEARADLEAALRAEGRDWIKGRTRIELARLAVQQGDPRAARAELERARALCAGDNDPVGVAAADEMAGNLR
jgi:tetratricopeptide (TPR) repeat protein